MGFILARTVYSSRASAAVRKRTQVRNRSHFAKLSDHVQCLSGRWRCFMVILRIADGRLLTLSLLSPSLFPFFSFPHSFSFTVPFSYFLSILYRDMKLSYAFVAAACASFVSAHGVVQRACGPSQFVIEILTIFLSVEFTANGKDYAGPGPLEEDGPAMPESPIRRVGSASLLLVAKIPR